MGKELHIVTPLHQSTKRDYLARMNDDKVLCSLKAREYEKDYWDGDRRFGYGGYRFIEGRWEPVARALIEKYNLTEQSSILDVGCGKGFLLFEIKKILPNIKIAGFDISNHALINSHPYIKEFLFKHSAQAIFPYQDNAFDLVISLGTLHNLRLYDLEIALNEIERVGLNKYVMVESYRNVREMHNLECWALTAETLLHTSEWKWFYEKCKYSGDYEFIFFE